MIQHGAPEYFEVYKIWKKSAKKREKKTREKKAHSGFHPGFKHFSCAMISFLILKFT